MAQLLKDIRIGTLSYHRLASGECKQREPHLALGPRVRSALFFEGKDLPFAVIAKARLAAVFRNAAEAMAGRGEVAADQRTELRLIDGRHHTSTSRICIRPGKGSAFELVEVY